MSAFGGISPTYHIALAENTPVIVWNFHSLLVMIQMCFSFMLTDSDCDMKPVSYTHLKSHFSIICLTDSLNAALVSLH